jgi:type I restriction enzyme S subunit
MSNIKPKRLGDLITLKRGYDLPEKVRIKGPFPVISSSGISGCHNDYKVEGEGVVTGRYGTLGQMYFVDGKYWPHNTALYVQDFKSNDPKYIYYLLSCIGRIRTSDKSAVPGVNRNELHEMAVPAIEDKNSQVAVRNLLWSIDKKIELNNKINTELEAMTKLIYDYWFVQFDFPDANGKPYKSSGGKMVYNTELNREIPDSSEVDIINNIIDVKDGTHASPKSTNDGYHLITSKNLKVGGLDFTNANLISPEDYESINNRSKVDTGDILFSMIGSIGVIYKVDEENINFAIKNVALYKSSQKETYKNYIYMFLKSYDMQRYMGNVISGSIQKFISLGALRNTPILINDNTIKKYEEKTKHIFKKLTLIKLENQKLVELRDWLLPMLMNGQVRVK